MAKLIREHFTQIKEEDATYIARIYGEQRTDGTWEGWIEFHPTNKSKPVLRTAQETSQPNYVAIRVLGVWLRADLSRRVRLPAHKGGCQHRRAEAAEPEIDEQLVQH